MISGKCPSVFSVRRKLVIRADASPSIGTGHVMRMIALGQAWNDHGGEVIFLSSNLGECLKNRILKEGFSLQEITNPGSAEDVEVVASLAHSGDWVALDGYNFSSEYLLELAAADCKLLVMDDMGDSNQYYADILLNQNNYGPTLKAHYRSTCSSLLLLGQEYALIRKEFIGRIRPNRNSVIRNVLVTLGGGDQQNITATILESLNSLPVRVNIKVLCGAFNPHFFELQGVADKSKHEIEIINAADDMAQLYVWADLVVSGAGSTCWELMCMNIPFIPVGIVDNQKLVVKAFRQQGVEALDWIGRTKPEELNDLLNKYVVGGAFLAWDNKVFETDGLGAKRTVMFMLAQGAHDG